MASIINATTTAGVTVTGDNSGSLQLATNNGTTAVTIDTSQNVLVGTTTSTNNIRLNQKIAVVTAGSGNFGGVSNTSYNGTTASTGPIYDLQRSRGITDGSMTAVASGDTLGYMVFRGSDGTQFVDSSFITGQVDGAVSAGTVPGRLIFNTSNTERMRIDSSGQATLTSTSGTGLSVVNNYTGNGTPLILTQAATNVYNALEIRNSSATAVFNVAANGNVTNTNNSYGGISDAKLKENIVDATPKLDKLMQVKVRNYNLKGDDLKQIGVVAQELEQVFPSLIEETTDKDADNNNLGTTTKSVKYSVFVPMLIKAIQELKATVDAQATTIAELQARLPAENT